MAQLQQHGFPGVQNVERIMVDEWLSGRSIRQYQMKNIRGLLNENTREEVETLWTSAFRTAQATHPMDPDEPGVIAFHPSLFSARRSEQYSTVPWAQGALGPDVDGVVLLIDDIFDMWERLGIGQRDLLHQQEWLRKRSEAQKLDGVLRLESDDDSLSAQPGAELQFNDLVLDSSFSILQRLLTWRHLDMIEAEALANSLHAPLTVLGVKHPVRELELLLRDPRAPRVYLSHPISRPRREYRRSAKWPDVVDQSNALSAAFADQGVALVCPTAIDEYRLDRPGEPLDLASRPYRLSTRWPLLVQPDDAIRPNATPSDRLLHVTLNPAGLEAVAEGVVEGVFARLLESSIYAEVPFRDHFLVSHTSGFLVYRPLYEESEVSGGVDAEIDHWSDLATLDPTRRALFVHTRSDVAAALKTLPTTRDQVRSMLHAELVGQGLDADLASTVVAGQRPRARMLDEGGLDATSLREALASAREGVGQRLIFSLLTSLNTDLLREPQVGVRILAGDRPSHHELEDFTSFLAGRTALPHPEAYLAAVGDLLQTSLVDLVVKLSK